MTYSVNMIPRVGGRPSTRSSLMTACSTSPGACTVAATRSIASLARSRQRTLTFDISQLPRPRNWGMAGGVDGRPGEAPVYAGTDFIIARDGRIAAVYLFFDQLP